MKEHIMPFIIGGLVIGLSVYLGRNISPKFAGILYWYPTVLVASILLMGKNEKKYAKDSLPAGILTFLFTLAYIYFAQEHGVWFSVFMASLTWIILSIITYYLIY